MSMLMRYTGFFVKEKNGRSYNSEVDVIARNKAEATNELRKDCGLMPNGWYVSLIRVEEDYSRSVTADEESSYNYKIKWEAERQEKQKKEEEERKKERIRRIKEKAEQVINTAKAKLSSPKQDSLKTLQSELTSILESLKELPKGMVRTEIEECNRLLKECETKIAEEQKEELIVKLNAEKARLSSTVGDGLETLQSKLTNILNCLKELPKEMVNAEIEECEKLLKECGAKIDRKETYGGMGGCSDRKSVV